MRRWLPRSVRFRTTLAATLVTAVVLGVASLVIVALVERDLKHNTRAALSDVLEAASHSADGRESQGREGGEQSESGEAAAVSGAPEAASAEPDGESINDVRQRLIADASIAEVRVGVDAASQALLIIVPAVVAVLALAIWLTVGRALRPVQAISSRVAAISGSTLDERVPEPDSGDEIAALAALMNEMLARLQAASDRQRAFVANASHELRSPLSTIVVAAEVAEVSPDPQKLQKLSERIGGEARRLQTLIADLLDLARLEEQRHARMPHRVDLLATCEQAIERADVPGATLTFHRTAVPPVAGVESQLERAVSNLVDNAVRYANRSVHVSLVESAATVAVVVEDDGPGIPQADRERVFDRFVRLDESRGRVDGGTGIGLSLVMAIAQRHGGTVGIDDSESIGGARFTFELPRSDIASTDA